MRTVMTVANLAAAKARIAESLGLSEDELLRQGLEGLLRERKRSDATTVGHPGPP